ncbi:ABC transporter substrate-binding protein [Demequina sp. NBRC 110054]|uniref:ABC transporter substrate-binding protein n=1 Tax=Demequina sp. NBRC 110054 TaxID=1570343 RepID=UPI000A06C879|nr:ABC transporter substrate-binding protein [Demequina sp. NBRC 110054]
MSRSPRKIAMALTAVAASLTLAACSAGAASTSTSSSSSTDAETPTEVTIGFGAEPASLDFTTTDGAAIPQALLDNVYEGLVTMDDNGDIQPLLAESWEVSDDNLTYTFTLASDVAFSNGDAFTAETVKWNIENVQSDNWTISLKSYMDVVDSVEVIDDTTVAVTLSSPSNDWLFRMTTRVGAMFDPDAVDDLATTAVGTGPYVVSSFNLGDSLVLEKNDGYWGDEPEMDTVTFKYIEDANAMNSALLSGSIDAIPGFASLDTLDQFSDESEYQILEGGTSAEMVLSLNNASGIFTDVTARQAVNYAIDRQTIIDSVAGGYGQLIGSMVPTTDPWFDESLVDAYPYDPEKAKELIAEAGIEGETIRFQVPSNSDTQQVAQLVASNLEQVGLNVEIEILEFPAQWLEQVFTGHDFDMSVINHVEARDLATYANPDYYWGYDSEEFQELIAAADAGTAEEQVEYLTEAAALLSEEAVSDWLYLQANITIAVTGLEGLPMNSTSESFNVTDLSWS